MYDCTSMRGLPEHEQYYDSIRERVMGSFNISRVEFTDDIICIFFRSGFDLEEYARSVIWYIFGYLWGVKDATP